METFTSMFNPIKPLYQNAGSIEKEFVNIFLNYKTFNVTVLISKISHKNQISLRGYLPIVYKSTNYGIPLVISFPYDYPSSSPDVYCDLYGEMEIVKSHPDVNEIGDVVTVRNHWTKSSNLSTVLENLCHSFSNSPPVRKPSHDSSKQNVQPSTTSTDFRSTTNEISTSNDLSNGLQYKSTFGPQNTLSTLNSSSMSTTHHYPSLSQSSYHSSNQQPTYPNTSSINFQQPYNSNQPSSLSSQQPFLSNSFSPYKQTTQAHYPSLNEKPIFQSPNKYPSLPQPNQPQTSFGNTVRSKSFNDQPSHIPLTSPSYPSYQQNNLFDVTSDLSKASVMNMDDEHHLLEGYNINNEEVIRSYKQLYDSNDITLSDYNTLVEDYLNSEDHYNNLMQYKKNKLQNELESLQDNIQTTTSLIEETQKWILEKQQINTSPKRLIKDSIPQSQYRDFEFRAQIQAIDECIDKLGQGLKVGAVDLNDVLQEMRELATKQFNLKLSCMPPTHESK
ncbi:hypothetical protein QTN25_010016 [Entamoeba marina]